MNPIEAESMEFLFSFAVGARSNNLDGYLINCQWDFDFRKGLFAEAEYSLMRKQENGKFRVFSGLLE